MQQVASSFSSYPVHIFTNNETISLDAQTANFNAADFIITPHGSHLAIAYLAERVKVILELNHQHHDKNWFESQSQKADNAHYFVSRSHKLANHDCKENIAAYQDQQILHCNKVFKDTPLLIESHDSPDCRSYPAIQSNLIIDLHLLESALQHIINISPG